MKRIKLNELENFRYFVLPKQLFSPPYENLSNDARIVFAILRDRFDLSVKNHWYNSLGEVYLIYPQEKLGKIIGKSKSVISRAMKELENAHLIERERQGLTRPDKIFIGELSTRPISEFHICNSELQQRIPELHNSNSGVVYTGTSEPNRNNIKKQPKINNLSPYSVDNSKNVDNFPLDLVERFDLKKAGLSDKMITKLLPYISAHHITRSHFKEILSHSKTTNIGSPIGYIITAIMKNYRY